LNARQGNITAMNSYLVLLRGINVGGKNNMPMARLRPLLEELGFRNVATHMLSGNASLQSRLGAKTVARTIEEKLGQAFKPDSSSVKVLALPLDQLRAIIDDRPKGFGDQPEKYHSDVIFLIGIGSAQALSAFSPLEGVDTIWPGDGVIYSQRLSSMRTKSRLNRMMSSPLYQFMTIRSWATTIKLFDLLTRDGLA
jgi:uncharacterized protein (DUF1697 family)